MQGIIIETTGSFYKVKTKNKNIYTCIIRGKIRLQNLKLTNPIAIGDIVEFEIKEKTKISVITNILPRKNYISRKSPYKTRYNQILAANLDLAILVTLPSFSESELLFIDKFLITTEFFNIKPLILFNKIDLLNKINLNNLSIMKKKYKKIGYNSLDISAKKEIRFEKLKTVLKGKISLLTGNSGIGKSTIINKLIPNTYLKTNEISTKTNKGKHTTTNSIMLSIDNNSFIIDTPGIRSLYPSEIEKKNIYHYFPEIKSLANCKFYNCIHIHEPGCKVIEAKEKGFIEEFRYNNYKKIVQENV